MKITINPTLDMETLEWVSHDGTYEYFGPLELFQGTSDSAKANEAAQTDFYKSMTQQQQTTFGEDQALFKQIQGITAPILAKGPMQYGFSPEMDALLQANIKDTGAKATANSVNATELAGKQARGGAAAPAGSDEALRAVAETLGNQATATGLQNEKLSGFQAGHQMYGEALGALTNEQSLLNPTGYANATTGAGGAATGAIHLADSERSNLLQSMLGAAVQGATGIATGELGTAMSTVGSGQWGW
ncbi:MAG: hypothetical protein ACYDHE_11335 [Candidatus Acidiferrales bacterium]